MVFKHRPVPVLNEVFIHCGVMLTGGGADGLEFTMKPAGRVDLP